MRKIVYNYNEEKCGREVNLYGQNDAQHKNNV